ncbi:hypothetical protein [Clostridium botulinum]|uniref:hypothetical protein n=1 Tax=Clostridium botulinum TaxID=1491 RepID=UPI000773A0D4|nr:hypothetical protein [Clostridium botulinum]MBY6930900.1 hypothetical protein [Clostridium botulinum]
MTINGLNDFNDFLNYYPKYSSKYTSNPIAKDIFNELSTLANINKMILASNSNKPALSNCIADVESKFANQVVFDLSDNFNKQAVGAMVKIILEPFGYEPIKQKKLPVSSSRFFKSASVYQLTNSPKIKLIQKFDIEKVL